MRLTNSLIKSTVVAALGGLLFGFDTAVIAGTTEGLTEKFHLSPALLGLTVAIALWGAIVGAMSAGIPGEHFRRRDSLRILAALYLISALGCALAWGWYPLLFAVVLVFRARQKLPRRVGGRLQPLPSPSPNWS